MSKIKIICLHGFLGQPTDWDLIQSHFMVSPLAQRFEWSSVDYMNDESLDSKNTFLNWAQNFNQKIASDFAEGPRVLVGYSMGGRLALHALAESPKLYDAVILLSTNPGLSRDKDKGDRWNSDVVWAEKFAHGPWSEVIADWNAQNVFKDSNAEPQRLETCYDRRLLASALTEWSLAKQADFRDLASAQQDKIFCMSGEKDIKFQSLTIALKKNSPGITAAVIPHASHRILFDNPTEVAARMIQFMTDKFA
ncbi:MAG: alpha/beta fold hydrolase [Bdellovibrionaceae bacterium]|nr:alpha/beta fold hydrolase [Pseudobdellovibrionaceae bacterium]